MENRRNIWNSGGSIHESVWLRLTRIRHSDQHAGCVSHKIVTIRQVFLQTARQSIPPCDAMLAATFQNLSRQVSHTGMV